MINVGVFFGGKSTEHEVSVISALQAIENMDKTKYNVIPVYMDKNNDFYYNKDGLLLDSKNYKDVKALLSKCVNVMLVKKGNKVYLRNVEKGLFKENVNILIDIAFPIVHGTNVEDGNLQGHFHTLGLPIACSDCLASAVSMDKYVMKEYCKAIGVPVIDAIRLTSEDYKDVDKTIATIEKQIGFPCIIKPVNLGSSIGIKKAKDKDSLIEALSLAFSFADIVLCEKAITNMREINCAVLGDKFSCETSALEEPFGNDEILSFTDKYLSGGKGGAKGMKFSGAKGAKVSSPSGSKGMASLQRKVPAELDDKTANEIKEYAKKIFMYIGCSGVSRIDFIIDKDTGKVYANEINPIPGSLSFYLYEPIGIKYKELLDKLITIALENYRRESKLNFSFENNLFK